MEEKSEKQQTIALAEAINKALAGARYDLSFAALLMVMCRHYEELTSREAAVFLMDKSAQALKETTEKYPWKVGPNAKAAAVTFGK